MLKEGSMDTLNWQKDEQVGPRAHWAQNIAGWKDDKTEAILLQAHYEKAVFFGEDHNARKKTRQQEKRKTKDEMDWLHKISCRHGSTGAEQGCRRQDIGDITHSESCQELEPTHDMEHTKYKSTSCKPMTKKSSVPVSFAWANGIINFCLRKK